jgi:hypothetical protein
MLLSIAACAADRPLAQSGSDEGVDVSTGELTDLASEPPCNATYCTNICALQISECDVPFIGTCVSDSCVCEPPSCVPCIEDECEPYKTCSGAWGECVLPCAGRFPTPSWAEVGCELPVPEDFPDELLDQVMVWSNGPDVPFTDDCARTPEGWTFTTEQDAVVLCELPCAAFEAGLELVYGWSFGICD